MPKKIFDIIPPKPKSYFESEPEAKKLPVPKRTGFKKALILVFGALILIGILGFVLPSRVQIAIWPETQTLDFREKVEVSTKQIQPNFLANIVPGETFEVVLEDSQEFPATGKIARAEQARGQIRVYNAYSTSPQVLLARTRFISADGKLFRSIERVIIPGGQYERGKLVPGFLDLEVVAAEPGPDYNIGPSTFSIPGFAGTPRYTAFYGKSYSPMTGGFLGESLAVSAEDIEKADNTLVSKLLEEGKKALRNKTSLDFILLEEAQKLEKLAASSSVPTGELAQSFNYRVKFRARALVFKKTDLENFAKTFIVSQISQEGLGAESFWSGKKLQEESLKMDYQLESIDWDLEKIVLDLGFSAKIYPDIDKSLLKKAILGKSLRETRILLENQPGVVKVQLKSWPFWMADVPQNEEKIRIRLNINGAID